MIHESIFALKNDDLYTRETCRGVVYSREKTCMPPPPPTHRCEIGRHRVPRRGHDVVCIPKRNLLVGHWMIKPKYIYIYILQRYYIMYIFSHGGRGCAAENVFFFKISS